MKITLTNSSTDTNADFALIAQKTVLGLIAAQDEIYFAEDQLHGKHNLFFASTYVYDTLEKMRDIETLVVETLPMHNRCILNIYVFSRDRNPMRVQFVLTCNPEIQTQAQPTVEI